VAIVNVTLSVFRGLVKYSECIIINIKSAVYVKGFLTFNRYMTK